MSSQRKIQKSIIDTIDTEELKNIVNSSLTYGEILLKLGFSTVNPGAKSHQKLKERLAKDNILTDHFYRRPSGKPKSFLLNLPISMIEEAVKSSVTLHQVMTKLNLPGRGGSWVYTLLKRRLVELKINTDHFLGRQWSAGKQTGKPGWRRYRTEELLRENTIVKTVDLKRRLIADKLLENKCMVCNLSPMWNGKLLVLQLDHINGEKTDNRLENLRIICPNCHTQTATYCGKHKKTKEK